MTGASVEYRLTVTEGGQERLDVWVARQIDMSRSQVKQLIDAGFITVNQRQEKAGYRLRMGDEVFVTIPPPQETAVKPENIPLEIVYQDAHIAVVNKPKGLVVHPAAGNWQGTLVNALLHHIGDLAGIGGELRPGIVHRLDKDTSGLMIVAKHDAAHRYFASELKQRRIRRYYTALVHGTVQHDHGTIDAPIGRHPKDRKRMAVVEGGRPAVTHFSVQERFQRHTLVECRLETGRTHQIRVHLSAINHPIVGDPVYGRKGDQLGATSQMLHAFYLGFHHLDGRCLEFRCEPPEEFLITVEKARQIS
ncbi:MAG: RluA family pseudouridine synthase [Firmicutes bacterium]|mgnify:CR=1 FL=1|jgi:23S rRNA pseudouridine1911/1915/1917 synthase|nr:RluA family pseudouridine synthase [Bacillota bacterium]